MQQQSKINMLAYECKVYLLNLSKEETKRIKNFKLDGKKYDLPMDIYRINDSTTGNMAVIYFPFQLKEGRNIVEEISKDILYIVNPLKVLKIFYKPIHDEN